MSQVLEKAGQYKGYIYRVVLNDMGHRCGYVKINEGQPYHNFDYEDIPITCHGGLTYDGCLIDVPDNDNYWIGFDCAHAGDARDWDAVIDKFASDLTTVIFAKGMKNNDFGLGRDYGEIRTTEYVERECKNIIDQLVMLEKGENEMTPNEYQELAARTINENLTPNGVRTHALHGMVGEIGEIHSIYQKVYQGHDVDTEHLKLETGDLLWFIAEYCTANGWKLEDIMQRNIEKLKARYPEGFEADKSLNRAEGDI